MSKIVGIDLGTTNSGVAIVKNGRPKMLPNGNENIIPSVVGYSPAGQWLIGTPARNQYVFAPENTVRSIKRKMGSDTRLKLGNPELTPPEISALILRELKGIAERELGEPVTDAIITVPAYFSDAQRQATRDAGRIAGFNVRRIINEPTAAALAYGLNQESDKMVLVYDLGGGTFDVSLVELMGGIVEVRASHGNTQLGGDDFDQRLAEHLADQFEEKHGIDLRQNPRAWARLLRAAENAKIHLSSHPFAWVKEEYLADQEGQALHFEYEVSRTNFVESIQDLLDQTLESIDKVLEDAAVTPEEIDQVLFVGGSTRIPAVWDLVYNHLNIEPNTTINPDEAVALGAGVQAAIIAGEPIDAILVDVTPHSLGIAVAERFLGDIVPDRYKVLIHRNTTIPVSKEEVFSTVYPGQKNIKIEVYQGEEPIASQNSALGEFTISDLKIDEFDGFAVITVKFDFDVDGILHVTAQDRQSKKQEKITVTPSRSRLAETEIINAQHWLVETKRVEPSGALKALLERANRLLNEGGLNKDAKDQLADLLADMQKAQTAGQENRLEELTETLLDFLFDFE